MEEKDSLLGKTCRAPETDADIPWQCRSIGYIFRSDPHCSKITCLAIACNTGVAGLEAKQPNNSKLTLLTILSLSLSRTAKLPLAVKL